MAASFYKFKRPLTEGLVKSRPNRFIMLVEIQGKLVKCHCPSTGQIGSITFQNIPCLLSKSGNPERKTAYTVEAISLDSPKKKSKSWIGINQTDANRYMEFFIKSGQLPRMVGKVEKFQREVKLGKSRIDFLVNGRDFIEAKTLVMTIPCEGHPNYKKRTSKFLSFGRLIKHYKEIANSIGNGSRAIFLLCFLYNSVSFVPPQTDNHTIKIKRAARKAIAKGVENWQLNLKVSKEGVKLLDYFRLNLF
ncbi:Sugar fermentation stimulation protein A [Candidatus Gugararchaeum adminiculabundum]|nr:Sugar fermentation stimulation protein A [Candidatus Gugararchaeum adminiculabundum]